jgi:SAM-dependent methyltransferase
VGGQGLGSAAPAEVIARDVRAAYDASVDVWGDAPDRLYSLLAEPLVAAVQDWSGRRVVDVGAGTGAVTRALTARGANVVAVDGAVRMLASAAVGAVAGDACALPLAGQTVDAVTMGFVLNHLPRPDLALREAARVLRPGGMVLATTWAREQDHPVREIVERALVGLGYVRPTWYATFKTTTSPLTDTVEGLLAAAAGLTASAREVSVSVVAGPGDLVAWRLGMAHHAGFVATLPPDARARLVADLTAGCAELPPLVCRILLLKAQTGA